MSFPACPFVGGEPIRVGSETWTVERLDPAASSTIAKHFADEVGWYIWVTSPPGIINRQTIFIPHTAPRPLTGTYTKDRSCSIRYAPA